MRQSKGVGEESEQKRKKQPMAGGGDHLMKEGKRRGSGDGTCNNECKGPEK